MKCPTPLKGKYFTIDILADDCKYNRTRPYTCPCGQHYHHSNRKAKQFWAKKPKDLTKRQYVTEYIKTLSPIGEGKMQVKKGTTLKIRKPNCTYKTLVLALRDFDLEELQITFKNLLEEEGSTTTCPRTKTSKFVEWAEKAKYLKEVKAVDIQLNTLLGIKHSAGDWNYNYPSLRR